MTPAILICAAGSSSRMRGGDKLLEPVGGEALLRVLAVRALETGARVLVALPPERPLRHAALAGLAVEILDVVDAAEGMAASLRAGAAVAGGGLLVMLGDMPEIAAADLAVLLAAAGTEPDRVIRAVSEAGVPGHPVVFPARLVPALAGLQGDTGAKSVLAGEDWRAVPLAGDRALVDLDTPEEWAAWRGRSAPGV